MVSSTLAWEEGCAFLQPSALQPRSACITQVCPSCAWQLVPARALQGRWPPAWLAPSFCASRCLPQSWKVSAPPQSSPIQAFPRGLWEVQVSTHQVGSSPHPPPTPKTAAWLTKLPCSCPQVPSATLFQTAGRRSQGKGRKKSCSPRIERPEALRLGQPVAQLLPGICISSDSLWGS